MRPLPTSRRARLLSVAVLAAALAAFPLGTLASHDFADVPDSNVFHADISALAASGVTTGCGGGNYCPSAFVTREQMAAFMNRLGALGAGTVPVVNADRLDGLGADSFLRSDLPETGRFNCIGSTMQPVMDGYDYTYGGNARILNSGSGYFNCAVLLPDGATVTAFRAGVFDGEPGAVIVCDLYRLDLYLRDGGGASIASVSSGVLFEAGDALLTDDTVSDAVIANDLYSYIVECLLSAASNNLSINGISVEYTVTGVSLP